MAKNRSLIIQILLGAVGGLAVLAGLVYLTGVVFFRVHFPFHTTFLGYDISQREEAAIQEYLTKEAGARSLTLRGRDGREETIPLADAVDYRRVVEEPAGGWIPPENAWWWPWRLFDETDLNRDVSIRYDREKLAAALDESVFLDEDNVTPPQDAYLEWQNDILVLIPEVDGNQIYRDRTLRKMYAAVEADRSELDLLAEGCYREPRVRSDDPTLNRVLGRYQAINFQRIEVDMTGTAETLTPDDVLALYTETGTRLTVNEEAVTALVQSWKDVYDTYERTRPFVDHYGDEISVGTRADTYGFKMDLDATVQRMLEILADKESVTIEPVWINAGWAREENGSDIGDTYIEVSISGQHLWAYVDGEQILSTDVVTGTAGQHDTPRGVFRILSMKRDAVLIGEDYETPVSYWMPLTWSGVGLHDASWRGSFGGSIYTYSGSHGCINLPSWAASELYWTYYAGTPVVVW